MHVTAFNALMWDSGAAPTHVIEHGILDPGHRYTGELARVAVVVNEPTRRGRIVGTDLVQRYARELPIDVFGMTGTAGTGIPGTTALGDVPQAVMHAELARRRVYLRPSALDLPRPVFSSRPCSWGCRWSRLRRPRFRGGAVAGWRRLQRPTVVQATLERFLDDPEAAQLAGKAARAYALERFGLDRFLADWDELITGVVA